MHFDLKHSPLFNDTSRRILQLRQSSILLHFRKLCYAGWLVIVSTTTTLPSNPALAYKTPYVNTILPVVFACLVMYLFFTRIRMARRCTRTKRTAVHALLKIFVPTRSLWPADYIYASATAEASTTRLIYISLDRVLRDIFQGRIELRNPGKDMSRIVKGRLCVDGWTISVTPGFSLRIKSIQWLIRCELSTLFYDAEVAFNMIRGDCMRNTEPSNIDTLQISTDALSRLVNGDNNHPVEQKPPLLSPSDSGFFEAESITLSTTPAHSLPLISPDRIIRCPSLDYVPRSHLEAFIRITQKSIKSGHHSLASIEFTTSEKPLSIYGLSAVLAFLPSLPRTNTSQTRARSTSTPLLTPLYRILALLTSGPDALTMLALRNISIQRAAALDKHAELLEVDPEKRRSFMKKTGLNGWREEKFYSYWESALFKEGILTRWVIVLGKNASSGGHSK